MALLVELSGRGSLLAQIFCDAFTARVKDFFPREAVGEWGSGGGVGELIVLDTYLTVDLTN